MCSSSRPVSTASRASTRAARQLSDEGLHTIPQQADVVDATGQVIEKATVRCVPVRAQRRPRQLLRKHQVGVIAGRVVHVQQRPGGMHLIGEQPPHLARGVVYVRDALARLVGRQQHAFERLYGEAPCIDVIERLAGAQPGDGGLRVHVREQGAVHRRGMSLSRIEAFTA